MGLDIVAVDVDAEGKSRSPRPRALSLSLARKETMAQLLTRGCQHGPSSLPQGSAGGSSDLMSSAE